MGQISVSVATVISLVGALAAGCIGELGHAGGSSEDALGSAGSGNDDGFGGGLLGSGGNGDGGLGEGEECEAVSQQAVNEVRPVDIIWAVDTSPSMYGAKAGVEQNLNVFAQSVLNAGIDVHVVLIAEGKPDGMCIGAPLGNGNCPDDNNHPVFLHDFNWVGSHNALGRFHGEYANYKPVLRKNSLKYFAVVTDDHPDISAAQFTGMIDALDPGWFDEWKMFGILCANKGQEYLALIQQTGGISAELCSGQPNYQQVFDALVQSVVQSKSLDCAWDIPAPPEGQVFTPNKVNVEYTPGGGGPAQPIYHVDTAVDCGPQGGWYYDDNASPTQVLACPATCDVIEVDLSGKIDILFGCHTNEAPK